VADNDLCIWHTFFGMEETNNDINVLRRSPVFSRLPEGHAPPVNFKINGHAYNTGYYLADTIYPKCTTFVKKKSDHAFKNEAYFATCRETCRKDVERAFGMLQKRFAIVRYLAPRRNLRCGT
jgi:hypothetical protein